ncbi:hypothetical protein [Mycolicibacterium vanbaalenii]|nr:hypothetical protein [Mycolicibacterium vanbaalenii]
MLVHAVDAQLHRVMARDRFDIEDASDALMVTVERLAPPPG